MNAWGTSGWLGSCPRFCKKMCNEKGLASMNSEYVESSCCYFSILIGYLYTLVSYVFLSGPFGRPSIGWKGLLDRVSVYHSSSCRIFNSSLAFFLQDLCKNVENCCDMVFCSLDASVVSFCANGIKNYSHILIDGSNSQIIVGARYFSSCNCYIGSLDQPDVCMYVSGRSWACCLIICHHR